MGGHGKTLSGSQIASQIGASKTGVNDFLRAFEKREKLQYPLPTGITNYGIAEFVLWKCAGRRGKKRKHRTSRLCGDRNAHGHQKEHDTCISMEPL